MNPNGSLHTYTILQLENTFGFFFDAKPFSIIILILRFFFCHRPPCCSCNKQTRASQKPHHLISLSVELCCQIDFGEKPLCFVLCVGICMKMCVCVFCFWLREILSYLNLNALFNLDIIHMRVSCLNSCLRYCLGFL
jgi:hypothetical protein